MDFFKGTPKTFVFPVEGMGAPRMTRRDRWTSVPRRPVVARYFKYRDDLRWLALSLRFKMPASNYHIRFYFPLPKGTPAKERAYLVNQPHQAKPDKDNLEKGFLDALCDDDAYIWSGCVSKFWGEEGRIEVDVYDP